MSTIIHACYGFKQQLMGIKVVDTKGNDITPQKLKDEKLKN